MQPAPDLRCLLAAAPDDIATDYAAVETFWRTQVAVNQSTFASRVDGLAISYVHVLQPHAEKAVIISNGRTESYLKYKEVVQDLYARGYSVFALDHRGQGYSGRLLENPQIGYVEEFDDYVKDLRQFVEDVVVPTNHQQHFIVAHSMGGAIASAYLEDYADAQPGITAAVMSAPMHKINSGRVPEWLTVPVLAAWSVFCDRKYFFGGGAYSPNTDPNGEFFAELTHSQKRYKHSVAQFLAHPETQLGGASSHWIRRAQRAAKRVRERAARIQTPVLILQAGADSVIDPDGHAAFKRACNQGRAPLCAMVVIERAEHELFIECDCLRTPVMQHTLAFLDNPQAYLDAEASGA